MNEGSSTTKVVLILIVIFVIITSAIVIVVIGKNSGWFEKKENKIENIPKSQLFLKALDYSTRESIDSDYVVESKNIKLEGELSKESYKTLEIINDTYFIYGCVKDNDYYMQLVVQEIGKEAKINTEIDCLKIEKNPVITNSEGLKEGENSFDLTINVNDYLRNLFLCFDWDMGIVYAEPDKKMEKCEREWENCTKYNYENCIAWDKKGCIKYECITYLPFNYYKCGDEKFNQCEKIEGNNCYFVSMIVPEYLKDKAKKCYRMDESLMKESKTFKINYEAWKLIKGKDKIRIYVGDGDFDLSNNDIFEISSKGFFNKLLDIINSRDSRDIKAQTVKYEVE